MQLVLWPVHNIRLEIFIQPVNTLPRMNKYTAAVFNEVDIFNCAN